MNATSMLVVLLQTTICLSAALAICACARKSSSVRLLVSQIAIVVAALFMIGGSWLKLSYTPMVTVKVPEPRVSVPTKIEVQQPLSQNTTPSKIESSKVVAKVATEPIFPLAATELVSTPVARPIATTIPTVSILYSLGLFASVVPMILGTVWIRKTRRASQLVTAGQTFDALARVADRTGIKAPGLHASADIRIPFVTGLLRKQIFVPIDWIEGQCDVSCIAVIEHEVAHIVSRDIEWKFVCRLVCALVWFQPLTWVLLRVMANASEELCDQSVLASGVANTSYANTLLEIRQKANRSNVPGLVIGAVSRESNLSKRMKLILATDPNRIKRASRLALWLAVVCFAASAATSSFVFGQNERFELSSRTAGAFTGPIRIFDYQGKPVIGARAWLVTYRRYSSPVLRQLTVNGNTVEVTDEANPKPHSSMLVIRTKEGMIDYVWLVPDKPMLTSFKMANPARIHGKIDLPKNISGPVRLKTMMISSHKSTPQAPSQFTMLAVSELHILEQDATTDAFGNFEMGNMLSGSEVTLQVDDDRISQDWADMHVKIDDNGHSPFFHHAARFGGSVEGRVTRDGKPMEGIRVTAQGQGKSGWGETLSDRNGNYHIARLEPDKYNVAAFLTDEQRQEFATVAQENLTIKAGDRKTGVNILAVRGGVIAGVVLDQQGHPAPDAQIGIYGPSHPHSSGGVQSEFADSSGHFRARVAAGDHQVYYMDSNGPGELVPVRVRDGEETSVRVHFPVKKPVQWIIQDEKSSKAIDDLLPTMIKDSTIVSLELLCRKTAKVTQVWRPNGGKPKIMRVEGPTSTIDQSISDGIPNGFYALVGIENLPSQMERIFFHSNSNFGSGNVGFATMSGKVWVPVGNTNEELQDFKIGIPVDYYKVHYRGKLNSDYTIQNDANGGQKLVFNVSANLAKKDLVLNATTSTGMVLRLSAGVFDKHGFAHGPTHYERSIDKGAGIVSVEVWYRDVAWATFKGVHMKSN